MQPRYQKSASRPSGSTYFGIWPLSALLARQRVQAGERSLLELRVAAAAHRQHADRRVAAEDARVASRHRGLGAAGGQDAVRAQVAPEQFQAGVCAGVDVAAGGVG